MEHLLGPKALAKYGSDVDEIPWLGFDHEGTRPIVTINDQQGHGISTFLWYPIHRGREEWEAGEITLSAFQDYDTLAMVQSWFFFGLWEAVLQQPLVMSDYIFDRDGHQVIKTQALRQCLHSFIQPLTEGKKPGTWTLPAGFSLRAQDTLRLATTLYNRISTHHDNLKDEKDPEKLGLFYACQVPAVLRMTLLSLDYMVKLFTYLIPGVKQTQVNLLHSEVNERSVRRRLEENNWCPSAYELLETISYSAAEYASLIPRPGSQQLHQSCSTGRCTARNVVDTSTVPTHVEASCSCGFWVPPLPELFGILEERRIPLLSANSILGHDENTTGPIV